MSLSSLRPRHRGFTLVEMIIVIIILAILALFGVPALMRAMRSASESVARMEIQQLDAGVNAFKTAHGFYPPDFTRINSANQFLNFLNRYAPNHSEGSQALGYKNGVRRVDVWWDQVGQYLGPENALTFWLSGLAKNKQFPLTFIDSNGNCCALPPYNVQVDGQVIERDVIHNFKSPALIPVFQQSGVAGDQRTPPPAVYPIWDTGQQAGYVCAYSQLADGGKEPVIYFELASFRYNLQDPAAQSTAPIDIFPHRSLDLGGVSGVVVPMGYVRENGAVSEYHFYNKDSFQIFASGMDSIYYENPRAAVAQPTNPSAADRLRLLQYSCVYDPKAAIDGVPLDKFERDTITNFFSGPLESVELPQ